MLDSQAGNISVRAFPKQQPRIICHAFDLPPHVASHHQDMIAKAMHRHEGLNGRLPNSSFTQQKDNRCHNSILRFFSRHRTGTVQQIASSTGYCRQAVNETLRAMLSLGEAQFTDGHDSIHNRRIWALARDVKPKRVKYASDATIAKVEAYLRDAGEQGRDAIADAIGANSRQVSHALQFLRIQGKADYRNMVKLGKHGGRYTIWRLTDDT